MKITRKEKVYNELKRLTEKSIDFTSLHHLQGYETSEIAEKVGISRTNASKELNTLVGEDRAIKIKGKPVLYLERKVLENGLKIKFETGTFESVELFREIIMGSDELHNTENEVEDSGEFGLIGEEGSLKTAIRQGKAAVIYPPKGLHTLIIGETGTGKSTFAECMYKYSVKKKILKEDAPFIVFNCADYTGNTQLLLAQLFGYVKGTFTGADRDKKGVVEQADGGILFLDEVHRLPAEGQEMLFYLMDKGQYRKLGASSADSRCDVRIILATTENPEQILLDTFMRRIPVVIKMPSLSEKTESERLQLVKKFFQEESKRIRLPISVGKEVLKAFLLYPCQGNIGQLKSDIQVICAKGFLDSMTCKKDRVEIGVAQLNDTLREGLFKVKDNRTSMIKDFDILSRDTIVIDGMNEGETENSDNSLKNKYNVDFYSIIKERWKELEDRGYSEIEIKQFLEETIKSYSDNMIKKYTYNTEDTFYNNIVNSALLKIVEKNIALLYCGEDVKKDRMLLVLALHIQHLIERIKIGNCLKHPEKELVKKEREKEFYIAENILKETEKLYEVTIPEDEVCYLATFIYLLYKKSGNNRVGILVIMHGESTAASMAGVANKLLNVDRAKFIDMPLDEKIQDVFKRSVDVVKEIDEGKGVLILGDMGTTLNFAEMITNATGIETKVIEMASTSIVIEATRKAMNPEMDLDTLYNDLLNTILEILNDKYNISLKGIRYFDNLLIENLNKTLIFLNGEKAYNILYKVLSDICRELKKEYDDALLVKFIYHCACMIERVIFNGNTGQNEKIKEVENAKLFNIIRKNFKVVEEMFGITISVNEYLDIVDLFKINFDTHQKNYI